MSTAHNTNLNPILNLLINCMSARSARQILPIKGERTFFFSNFLIIGLFNSLANYLFDIVSFLIVDLFHVARIAKVSDRKVSDRKVFDRASVAAPPEVF